MGQSAPPFSRSVILVIRHAEKPDEGSGLTPAGEMRAQEYVSYFEHYKLRGRTIHLDALYAAKDSRGSQRPRLTITPLSQALGLPISASFKDKDCQDFVDSIAPTVNGKTVLICWHHGEMPDLLAALGADPDTLLPNGKWPPEQFGWVIQLCYDQSGHLIPALTRRVLEDLPTN